MILNGGPMFKPSPAASISVLTKDQEETDRLWAALTAGGGEESRCGWVKDKFGVSWQIVPDVLPKMMNAPDKAANEEDRHSGARSGVCNARREIRPVPTCDWHKG